MRNFRFVKWFGFTMLAFVIIASSATAQQVGPQPAGVEAANQPELDRLPIRRGQRSVDRLEGQRAEMTGDGELLIHERDRAIDNALVEMNSEDCRVLFESVRPSEINQQYLSFFRVNGVPAKLGENVRLTSWVNGTIVTPHGDDYQPLQTYNATSYRGESRGYVVHRYYKAHQLGEDEDQIASFILKRGYMATFAENEDGTGASQVFIAYDRDLRTPAMPAGLRGKVSFIRVFPWRYTGKKGHGGQARVSNLLNAQWRYDWSASGQSTLDMEYVPMRHNRNWDSWQKINRLENVTHLLGFNEPMQKDQSNMTMEQCLNLWPKLQQSGLRLGSPCPTDGGNALNWLYEFLDKADARGLRVDFVAVHYYKGGQTDQQLTDWLRRIHQRTGRPLWVTEWNNGAPWVRNHNPSMQENARRLAQMSRVMDRLDFVERYAIFNVADARGNRQIFKDGRLTHAGERYRDNPSAEAYTGEPRRR